MHGSSSKVPENRTAYRRSPLLVVGRFKIESVLDF